MMFLRPLILVLLENLVRENIGRLVPLWCIDWGQSHVARYVLIGGDLGLLTSKSVKVGVAIHAMDVVDVRSTNLLSDIRSWRFRLERRR